MSQPNPKYSEIDFAPKRERRGSATITNLPVNALTDDVDPTQEIRNLINELQTAARDSKTRAQQMEQERDDLATQLEESMTQLADLRGKEREFRQQFMEVSALLRERDEALETSERNQRKAADLERKLEAATRERNDAQRQRDESMRQREEATRQREEHTHQAQATAAQLAQAQKQVLSIRQARDAAQAQGLEHINNLQRLRDELADLSYARDAAQQAAKKAGDETAELRFQLDAAAQERAAAAQQQAELSAELDVQRAKLLDLAEQKSQAAQADSEHSAALAEAREQMLHITQERDAARARAQEQARELDEVRGDLQKQRDELAAAKMAEAEREEFQRQLAHLTTDRDAHLAREKEFLAETITQQERLAQLTDQLMAAQKGREEALTSLTSAQKQIDHIVHDRDAVRQQGIDNSLAMEAQVAALRDQMAVCVEKTEEADLRLTEMHAELGTALDKAAQAEKQRLFAIDLATQLDNAKRDLIRLTADLAEARLQAKFALTRTAAESSEPQTVEVALDGPAVAGARPPLPETGAEPLTEKDARGALSAMKHCHQSFTKQPGDFSLLNELHCHIHSFAERARVSGYVALHRLGAAFATFVDQLYRNPEQVNPSTQRTLGQTIEFLGVLLKQRNYATLKDPAKAVVYVVDDDADNGEAIKLGMESVMLRTQTSQDPAIAIAELASGRYDLIFLDVNLPNTNGFELCQQIRQLAIHARTPIVFLTGLTTIENRVQSSLSGGNDFVGKPFNLHELSVKALTLVLKASLNME